MRSETDNRGFTLLEICVALAVLAIFALLSLNPMNGYLKRLDFKNSSMNIKRLVQMAQSKAMANPNVHVGVYFDLASRPNKAFLFQDKVAPHDYRYDGKGDPEFMQPETLKQGIAFRAVEGYPGEVVFRGDGSAWKSFKIVLTNGTLTDTLDVLASTGRVRVGK